MWKKPCIIVLCYGVLILVYFNIFYVCLINFIAVDLDYFTENALRAEEKDVCYNNLYKLYCTIKCGTKIGLCIEKYCYCVYAVKATKRNDGSPMIYLARPEELSNESDLNSGTKIAEKVSEQALPEELGASTNYYLRPTLRHHIAHFCPNLDIARDCIRTCMKEGKPAFCGKDHVCYCGHKYNSRDEVSNQNLAETYSQFHDLYEKYFGTHNYAGDEEKIS